MINIKLLIPMDCSALNTEKYADDLVKESWRLASEYLSQTKMIFMHLYRSGIPMPLLSEWLGHAQMETTVNIKYPHKFKVTVKAA